jgi:opacity protein-like surface antigen
MRMKRACGALLLGMALSSLSAFSQTERGSWELSLAGNMGIYSTSSEYTSAGRTTTNDGEALGYFGLDLRAGYYVVDGLSVEPEIYMLAVEKSPPAFNIGANASYTFTIRDSPVKPFVIAGYGIGNGVPVMQRIMGRTSSEFDIPVLRVGGGLKVFLSQQVALKAEYRYERFSYEETSTYYSYTSTLKRTWNYHNVLFGVSVFL